MFLSPPVIAIISVQDVVVSSSHRGKQLGKLVVSLASVLAARLGCYKVTLELQTKLHEDFAIMGKAPSPY